MAESAGSGEASGRAGKNSSGNEEAATAYHTAASGRLIAGRRKVIAALLVAMTVTAMEQLVVSPAMPTIIAQLKGFEIYPWVISAYLLAATVSTPIYGKLADLFGRKRVLLFGLALFSAGSMLSGTAESMGQLIAMRTIQGLDAGAVSPIVLTLLGDLFTLEERARIQGLFSAVWGLSSVSGPLIGGWLTVNLNWRWVFFVCVPFAATAFLMVTFYFHERIERRTVASIDWAGAGLLSAGLSALLLVLLDGSSLGVRVGLAMLGLTAFLLVAFVIRERRAADPILPMDLMVRPTIATSVIGSFLIGGILFGIETYVPLFIQGVRGGNASQAGQALTPLFLSWAVSVALAAKAVVRWGFRRGAMFGAGLVSLGALALTAGAMFPAWSRPIFTLALIVVGMGMGPSSLGFILAVQNAVSWGQRGVATGAVIFFRTIGGAIGVGSWAEFWRGSLARSWPRPARPASTSQRPCGRKRTRCSNPVILRLCSRPWASLSAMSTSRCCCWLWVRWPARPGCPERSRPPAPVVLHLLRRQQTETVIVTVMAMRIDHAIPSPTWPRSPRSARRLGPDARLPHRGAATPVTCFPGSQAPITMKRIVSISPFRADRHAP